MLSRQMKPMRLTIKVFLLIFLLTSCGQTSTRVKMIEEYSDLKLPSDYHVLQAKSESSGLAGADFQVTVELEFDSRNFNDLLRTVPKNSNDWREEGGNFFYSKEVAKGEYVEIIIDHSSRQLLFRFDHI
jgi:hypothetical protein